MPNSATLKLKECARRLLACEAAAAKPGGAKNSTAFRVCEKLHLALAKLMGAMGFRALLSRALALASAEVHWLGALHIKADGTLEGLEEVDTKRDRDEIAEGEVVLVAHLLGLLVTFIGPELTLQLVQEAWPKAALDDLDS
jgi:hypothetical protein